MSSIDLNDLANAIGQLIVRTRLRRRTASEWTVNNEVLYLAEMGFETDTGKLKVGDGRTRWNDLDYFSGADGLTEKNAGAAIEIDQAQDTEGGSGGDFADDPDFASVGVLCHFDSLDSFGDAIDSGPLGIAITPVGAVSLIATDSVFGGYSVLSAPVTTEAGWKVDDNVNLNFGNGDFTVEGWFKGDNVAGTKILFRKFNGDTQGFRLSDDGIGFIAFYCPLTDGTTPVGVFAGGFKAPDSPGSNVWVHVALVRHANLVNLYLNGVAAAQPSGAMDIGTKTLKHDVDPLYIGTYPGGVAASWSGKYDEIRVAKVARYTANFTPPVAQFPGYSTPLVNIGKPYAKIINIGVRSLIEGDGVTIDDSDPYNPIVTNTGVYGVVQGVGVTIDYTDPHNPVISSSSGGGTPPVPVSPIFWGETLHRDGVVGGQVFAMNAPGFQNQVPLIATGAGVLFDTHGADFLTKNSKMVLTPTGAGIGYTEMTIIAAIHTPASWSIGTPGTIASGTNSNYGFRVNNAGGTCRLEIVSSQVSSLLDDSVAGSLSLDTAYVVSATTSVTTHTLRRNGSQTATGPSSGFGVSSGGTSGLTWIGGIDVGGGEAANFQLAAILIYDRVLTSTELTQAETYMATRNY